MTIISRLPELGKINIVRFVGKSIDLAVTLDLTTICETIYAFRMTKSEGTKMCFVPKYKRIECSRGREMIRNNLSEHALEVPVSSLHFLQTRVSPY